MRNLLVSKSMGARALWVLSLCAGCATMRADFTYQETTQMTGGSMLAIMRAAGPFARQAREPIVSTHIIKGNRMATVTKDHVTVMDLDKETVTTIDLAKKTYSVMTFAEMKQMLEDAQQRLQKAKTEKGDNSKDPQIQASFKVSAKATGQTKSVQGLTAKEVLITMDIQGTDQQTGRSGGMSISTDTWMAPVPGYEEVKAFHQKMAVKMGYAFGSNLQQIGQMGMGRPEVSKGFEEVAKEMAKLDGVPVQSVVKMGGSGDAPPDAGAAQSQQRPQQQQQQQADSPGAAAAAAALGRLGGFGGLGRKKKTDDQPPPQQASSDQPPASGSSSASLMETTTEMTSFSSAPADASKFEIPAGFKQVQPDARRGPQ